MNKIAWNEWNRAILAGRIEILRESLPTRGTAARCLAFGVGVGIPLGMAAMGVYLSLAH